MSQLAHIVPFSSRFRRACVALAAFVAVVLLGLGAAPDARAFETGYNVAWFGEAYGRDFTRDWDESVVEREFARTRAMGGRCVRLWLFEGMEKDGVTFQGARATGLAPGFLANVERTCAIARRHGVRVYWTGLNGNWPWAKTGSWWNIHYNIVNDKYGAAQSFRARALGPVLDVLARNADTVYAFDVMNEVEGSISVWAWPDAWTGARKWIREEVAFVRTRLPGVAVTASAGWATASENLTKGRYSGLGLDFYDIHVYDDQGRIPDAFGLRMLSWRTATPILLGEFGQKSERRDDALQRRATKAFLDNAKAQNFLGALGWRLDDERPSVPGYAAHHSFIWQGRERPAAADVRAFAARVGDDRRSAWDQVRAWRAGR